MTPTQKRILAITRGNTTVVQNEKVEEFEASLPPITRRLLVKTFYDGYTVIETKERLHEELYGERV